MRKIKNYLVFLIFSSLFFIEPGMAQERIELNSGWKTKKMSEVDKGGEEISQPGFQTNNWMPAVVPGTILATMLENKLIPDPNYGMNNEMIPDIFDKGIDYYTYWFVNDLANIKAPDKNEQVWLHFRGVNYSCDVYLNGKKLNKTMHKGMFLRQIYNITNVLAKDGKNRLAVIVFPPDPPGNPNGGQGGDGVIGKSVTHQYVAGWDWIQPVRDRNTGIWDKVFIERTGPVNIQNPHVVTRVDGIRQPDDSRQDAAVIRISAELNNPTDDLVTGILRYSLDGKISQMNVSIKAGDHILIQFPDLTFDNPKLWWPNGYGRQDLYDLKLEFLEKGSLVSDAETVRFGIREITYPWNAITRSREFTINGQRIFIKGGNWIISDAMLRFSKERYDAEVRFHRDANLNMIRIWGGAITERPEFYEACDKYGIMVWQDFWTSGDCNGRWQDPRKKDDQWTRSRYPDDHGLFIASVVDQVKMIRNHPSLTIWCGGNEVTPSNDINEVIVDTLKTDLDGTRLYIESSTSGDLYYNFLGGTGDGPYGIQEHRVFWEEQSYPFNPELGSVGTGDYESLKRFIPDTSMIIPGKYQPKSEEPGPRFARNIEPVWRYHKFSGYGNFIERYKDPESVMEFADLVQIINYDQYRALVEGFSSHMWEWYTGFNIWKTQNPWTALRGQLYDWYLDPNACLYGLTNGSEPLHIMFNPVSGMIQVANNTFATYNNAMAVVKGYDHDGKVLPFYQQLVDVSPASVKQVQSIGRGVNSRRAEHGLFLSLKLYKSENEVLSENLYWLPDSSGNYPMIRNMKKGTVEASAVKNGEGKIEVTLANDQHNPLAFFIRISMVDSEKNTRILPVFYSDNYVSIEPGDLKEVTIDYLPGTNISNVVIQIKGWNVDSKFIKIENGNK
ncbi:MAG TPA: glycoside hydrolase family 2 TIM barrel-domain containing protein [Cyclobacteriaceae bacterium]|nr:glycoside hydrolase family 2 TIM barrel-domain containing protein [Cyclobacteriaceae bacterium]